MSVQTIYRQFQDALEWRTRFLRDSRHFTVKERATVLIPIGARKTLHDLLRSRTRKSEDGATFIEIGGERIFLSAAAIPESELLEALNGFYTVIREAYCAGPELLRGGVDVEAGDTVLDIGANVGTSALYFSRLVEPGGVVYSFEPIHTRALQRTLSANNIENVVVIPCGVADANGTATFSVTKCGIDARVSKLVSGRRAANTSSQPLRLQPVRMLTIDSFVEEHKLASVDLIKLDIEGAEEQALLGADKTLRRFHPRLTIASYHTGIDGSPQHQRIVELLRTYNYSIEEVERRHIYAC